MLFPFGDDNLGDHIPVATIALIAINVFIYIGFAFKPGYETIIEQYGFIPDRFDVLNIFASMFLHANIFHLIINMWFLWLFGDSCEGALGIPIFILLYLLAGASAATIHLFACDEVVRSIPCIGASGAVSGVMGEYIVLFPKARIKCAYFVHTQRSLRVSVSAFVFLGTWFAWQVFQSLFLVHSNITGIIYTSFWAHIGGFLFGAGMALLFKNYLLSPGDLPSPQDKKMLKTAEKGPQALSTDSTQEKKDEEKTEAGLEELKKAIDKCLKVGNIDLALEKYAQFEQESIPEALEPQSQQLIAETLLKQDKKIRALQAYLRFIFVYKNSEETPAIKCRLGLLYIRDFGNPAEGMKYLRQGLEFSEKIGDKFLLEEARKELKKTENSLEKALAEILAKTEDKGDAQERFTIFAQSTDDGFFDAEEVFKALMSSHLDRSMRSPGVAWKERTQDIRNIGMRLAYNFEENCKTKDGILLQKLEIDEALLAAGKLHSLGIPILILRDLLNFSRIVHIKQASIEQNEFFLRTDDSETIKLPSSEVSCVVLGQIPYHSYSVKDTRGLLDIKIEEDGQFALEVEAGRRHINRLLDIFVVDSGRYRISSPTFSYKNKWKEKSHSRKDDFKRFAGDLTSIVGAGKIDEGVRIFTSTNSCACLNYANVKEFNEKGLRIARLRILYERLLLKGKR